MVVKSEERIRLPRGAQQTFIDNALARSGGVDLLSQSLNVCPRTIRDWRREKFLMSYQAVMSICKEYDIAVPEDMIVEDPFWYVTKGASRGGKTSYATQGGQIGNPTIRKQKWLEWWEREGKFKQPPDIPSSSISQTRTIY